jgi:hypothetical protein
LKAKSNVSDRGAAQYGGNISLYLPADFEDASNDHKVVYDTLSVPRTRGYLTMQIDGELSETNTATYVGGLTQTAVAGDLIDVFDVMTAGYSNAITGEEAFRETISFMPQGAVYINAVVAVTPVVSVTPATGSPVAGAIIALAATVNGRKFTRGVRWTSSNVNVATVSQNGIVTVAATAVATNTATITATYLGVTDTYVLTV